MKISSLHKRLRKWRSSCSFESKNLSYIPSILHCSAPGWALTMQHDGSQKRLKAACSSLSQFQSESSLRAALPVAAGASRSLSCYLHTHTCPFPHTLNLPMTTGQVTSAGSNLWAKKGAKHPKAVSGGRGPSTLLRHPRLVSGSAGISATHSKALRLLFPTKQQSCEIFT